MGLGRLINGQLCDVIEWENFRDDQIFYKWQNNEIKKGSRLIIHAGQDAILLYNGRIEGVFKDDGDYDIESDIIPFLSTLKGFKFGFNSGLRAEVLFINTKEFNVKWGTKNPINIPSAQLPGGIPIRANGSFCFKVSDYLCFIEKVAGVKNSYIVDDIKERVASNLDQLLMKWITKEGKDMFNLQASSYDISEGIKTDLDMILTKIGLTVTEFNVNSFNYPKEIQDMVTKVASQSMVGDMSRYSQMAMIDNMGKGGTAGNMAGGMANQMAQMQMGVMMGQQMMGAMQGMMPNMQNNQYQNQQPQNQGYVNNTGKVPKFCPECGTPTNGAKFCPECGCKLI